MHGRGKWVAIYQWEDAWWIGTFYEDGRQSMNYGPYWTFAAAAVDAVEIERREKAA